MLIERDKGDGSRLRWLRVLGALIRLLLKLLS